MRIYVYIYVYIHTQFYALLFGMFVIRAWGVFVIWGRDYFTAPGMTEVAGHGPPLVKAESCSQYSKVQVENTFYAPPSENHMKRCTQAGSQFVLRGVVLLNLCTWVKAIRLQSLRKLCATSSAAVNSLTSRYGS